MIKCWAIILVLVSALCGGIAPVLIKIGTKKNFKKITDIIFNIPIISGIMFYGLGTIFFIPALKGGDVSILYSFIATSYVWAIFFSWKILNEKITKSKIYGILFIIIGIIFIGLGM